ncbi:MAG: carboxypeptidase-like regulatory domain-containing protein [Bacteroidetes bacterium]|nr:carboxypeptidase-like regulatory domain-containing protein [Bacteroidota bacterium]
MRTAFTLIFSLLSLTIAFAQEVTLKGKVTDQNGNAVPFASVYIRNTTKGASANSEGDYSFHLQPGHYELRFKAVGYKQELRSIDLKENTTLNVTLGAELYELNAVTISATGEDPAYAIIRKAIRKRKAHLTEVKAYTCEVYIKGMQKLVAAPKKFMGADINQIGKEIGLDSNRRGIVYLSESESKLAYKYPGQLHEEMISSKFAGSNRMFSFNRASDAKVNFYENFQDWGQLSNRPLISPISDNALFYYKYKLMGTATENGVMINKIKVTPKRGHDPCFDGYIYIIDDSWRIYALNLFITSRANINFADTLRIDQQFLPIDSNRWMQASNKLEFSGGLLGFRLKGYFVSVYKDYDLNPTFSKSEFNELLYIPPKVAKNDSAYWNKERPIPLTQEEKVDYVKKDKLAAKRESKQYLDSLDKVTNKVNPGSLVLTGVNIVKRYKREFIHLDPLVTSILYNTVEGPALNYGFGVRKEYDSVTHRAMGYGARVRYGFSDHLFDANANAFFPVGNFYLNVAGGSDVVDLNSREPIGSFINSFYTLFERENYEKLYQKKFATASLSGRIMGGWQATATVEWADRKWLPNSANYSFFHPGNNEFTSNNPFTPAQDVPLFPENQSFKVILRTTYDFSSKYETYPFGRRYLPSDYPAIGISYTKGIRNIFGSDVDYDLLSADISKQDISLGMYGRTSFYLGAGKFLNTNRLYYPDYKQFSGNEVFFAKGGINSFLMLDYYLFSTPDKYIEGHLEHNFSGFFLNKIPLIRKLKLQEIIDVNYLSTPTLKNYYELGFGLQYLNIRLMYGESFNSGSNIHNGLRLGVSF